MNTARMPPVRQAAARHAVGRTGPPRDLAEETAVALSFDGTTQAVMMATPADLEDFARGFALTEGIAAPGEIDSIAVVEAGPGLDVQVWLRPGAAARLSARRRVMAGPVGCGLCGLDSVAEALRPPPPLPPGGLRLAAADVRAAIAALPGHQPLHDATRAVHAAGFWRPGHGMVAVREDVGRHNALDKLAGALAAAGVPGGAGAVVMTSRLSIDLVQKCARIGAPVLIAASAPTAHAVRLAEGAGLTLCALARAEGFELFTHPGRILTEGIPDVA